MNKVMRVIKKNWKCYLRKEMAMVEETGLPMV
jgi:hypothetical protein